MGLGLQGAYGLEGGWDALAQIIATRKKDELLAQAEQDRQRQLALQEAQQAENDQYRRMTFEGLQQDRQARNEDRDAARKSQDEARQQAEQDRKVAAIRARFNLFPIGQQVGATDLVDAREAGIDPLLSPSQIDPTNPNAPQTWTYSGSSAQQQHVQDAADRKAAQDEANTLRLEIARLAKSGGGGDGRPYYNPIPDTGQPSGISAFNARTGKLEPVEPVGGQSHLVGPAAKNALAKVKDFDEVLANLDTLETVGKKTNWQGTGPLAGVRGMLSGAGLLPDPTGDQIRATVGYVRALIAHPLFGSAFTATEKAMMDSFVANPSLVGPAQQSRIEAMRNIVENARSRWLQGIGPRQVGADSEVAVPESPVTLGSGRNFSIVGESGAPALSPARSAVRSKYSITAEPD
jgi:hypothetical protein